MAKKLGPRTILTEEVIEQVTLGDFKKWVVGTKKIFTETEAEALEQDFVVFKELARQYLQYPEKIPTRYTCESTQRDLYTSLKSNPGDQVVLVHDTENNSVLVVFALSTSVRFSAPCDFTKPIEHAVKKTYWYKASTCLQLDLKYHALKPANIQTVLDECPHYKKLIEDRKQKKEQRERECAEHARKEVIKVIQKYKKQGWKIPKELKEALGNGA